jgi:ribosome-interacting GTPase 1
MNSIKERLNFNGLLEMMWNYLDFVRVFTKPKGE